MNRPCNFAADAVCASSACSFLCQSCATYCTSVWLVELVNYTLTFICWTDPCCPYNCKLHLMASLQFASEERERLAAKRALVLT